MGNFGSSTRRWKFADCVFDEGDWSLTVAGRRVAIESKPLAVLRELLDQAGTLVTKDQLLDAIWPHVSVVEASLPTAVHKLRLALNDDERDPHLIETVPRRGYRFTPAVGLDQPIVKERPALTPPSVQAPRYRLIAFGVVAAAIAATAFIFAPVPRKVSASPPPDFSTAQVKATIRRLDVDRVEKMIEAGWKVDTPINPEGDTPLGFALGVCEWDPGHDPRKLQLMVRTLLDGGARLDHRNAFGDTPYSIAKAPRYCGPNHPVTQMIRRLCGQGLNHPGDGCMASYELARGRHFTLGT